MKIFTAVIIAAFGLSSVSAKELLPLTGIGVSGNGIASPGCGGGSCKSAYIGPGDVVSGALVWYSCFRAYNAAYATGSNPGCNITRASDSHTCDVLINTNGAWGNTANCSTGGDNGQTASSFCTSTTCSVDERYDQSGSSSCSGACNELQATAADQPALLFTGCQGGLNPCMSTTTTAMFMETSATLGANHALPLSFSVTGAWGNNSASAGPILSDTTMNDITCAWTTSGGAGFNCYNGGAVVVTVSTTAAHAINVTLTNPTQTINLDGTESSGSGGTAGIAVGDNILFGKDQFGNLGDKNVDYEDGLWGSGFSSGNRTALCRNQQAFYGAGNFGASC